MANVFTMGSIRQLDLFQAFPMPAVRLAPANASARVWSPDDGSIAPSYVLRTCGIDVVESLCADHHGYGSAGGTATYAWTVVEDGRPVAAYAWQPPPPGAAKALCPVAPAGVLALSRMVAVPREERRLNHVSKPLRRQMRTLIDRGRWPVLVTYSDEGEGHTGHVYKCSGWTPTTRRRARFYLDERGRRASSYSNGAHGGRALRFGGHTWLQRWEHRVCDVGQELAWMESYGWRRVPVPGKRWRSGNQAYTWQQHAS
jgi:hypothetical protein